MNAPQVARMTARSREAAADWSAVTFGERERRLRRWAAELARSRAALVATIREETGKPAADAELELLVGLEHLAWTARRARRTLRPRRVSPGLLAAEHRARVERRPLGVVGVIGPWNYPALTPLGVLAGVLAAGNAAVFKPSEHTTETGRALVDAFERANPGSAGTLRLLTGGARAGEALCRAGVDKVAFIGSTRTGRAVMAACADSLTPVVLECGGNDALIVGEDADVRAAARAAVWGAFSNAGQTCAGVERIYVARAVGEEFIAALTAELAPVRAGLHYGRLTTGEQEKVVRVHVEDATAHGGRFLFGGPESFRTSGVVDPVVLTDVPEGRPAVQEETFGPVAVVRLVRDLDEGLTLANAVPQALGAAVFSRSADESVAARLRAGMVSVNGVLTFGGIPGLPFGGNGASGFGRVHGREGLMEFTSAQAVTVRRAHLTGSGLTRLRSPWWKRPVLRALIRLRHG
ncbi:aldehyde dehydrogenase family protein [Streptomyces sp. H27-S2]|uniref:aldehyde dehydrogenase family protein n=1 Tax=Streptomyces antarcticus TaxID=2996458 RepID=UPI002270133E|nr:aldehyde dehydrogenase family protein [Streptomyces sp. H27-S2]MCY0949111.1 aldehyde dehydrogenase family protein [Streptomyces sp. H27-S2]